MARWSDTAADLARVVGSSSGSGIAMRSSTSGVSAASGDSVEALAASVDSVQSSQLPSVRKAGEDVLVSIMGALHGPGDGASRRDALARLHEQLHALEEYLRTTGIGGAPLADAPADTVYAAEERRADTVYPENEMRADTVYSAEELRAATRRAFERRARTNEATAMVSSIFSGSA
ncbi:hypothetical protein MSPP1_002754 [Malassezia sp. CBS 17886]|nr:hypothetical protein MSPP1_002754 [Malassezia sp. CBS 17886]